MNTESSFQNKLAAIGSFLAECFAIGSRRSNPDLFDMYVINRIKRYGLQSDYARSFISSFALDAGEMKRLQEKIHVEEASHFRAWYKELSWRVSLARTAVPQVWGEPRKLKMRGGWQPARMRGEGQRLLASGSIQPPAPEVKPATKPSKRRKKGALNTRTKRMLGFYIKHRDGGAKDKTARMKAVHDMNPAPTGARKVGESLDRAVKTHLNDGDYTEVQARKFRKL